MPNFLKVQLNPYNSATHSTEEETTQFDKNVQALIRWRFKYDKNGNVLLGNTGSFINLFSLTYLRTYSLKMLMVNHKWNLTPE